MVVSQCPVESFLALDVAGILADFLARLDDRDDDLADSWMARIPGLTIGVIPLLADKRPMPTQECVGCDDGRQFHEGRSAERLAYDGQQPSMFVRE